MPTRLKNLCMMEKQAIKVAVIGAGGVGAWVAMSLADRGHRVFASTRSAWTARALALSGVDVVEWHCFWGLLASMAEG